MFNACHIVFNLDVFDWTAIGAIISLLMVIVTFLSLCQNRRQLREMKKQWDAMHSPHIELSIVVKNEHFVLKVENEGDTIAHYVQVKFDKKLKELMFCKHLQLAYSRIETATYSVNAHSSKYFYLWPIYGQSTITYFDTNEHILAKKFQEWVESNAEEQIVFECIGDDDIHVSHHVRLGDCLGYTASVIDDETSALLQLNKTLEQTNVLLSHR